MFKQLKTGVVIAGLALAIGAAGVAHAQYVGPGDNVTLTTVGAVLKKPVDDQHVLLRGRITKKLKKEYYEFTDSSGTIRVEIDDKYFNNIRVNENSIVEIYGEVDTELLRAPKIEVKRLTLIQP